MSIVNTRNAVIGWAVREGRQVRRQAEGEGVGAGREARRVGRGGACRRRARRVEGAEARPQRAGMSGGGLFRDAIADLIPYEPGKPVEEVQRELGLDRVVKLASNEGPFPPFPAALEAIERAARDLNRYPDGGVFALRAALAELHGVRFEEVVVAAGADAVIDLLSQAALDPGDEIVCGWPSFPSYVIDAAKMGAVARTVPLRDHVYDLDGLLAAIGPRTKLVYVCHPNNPTGTANGRDELLRFLDAVPEHVLRRARPGVLRVHRRSRLPGRDRGGLQAGPPCRRPAHVLEDLRPRGPARRLRDRSRRRRRGDEQGAARVRRHLHRAGGGAREHRRRRGDRAAQRAERRGPGRARGRPAAARARAGRPRDRELPLRRGGRRARRSSSSCSGTARSCGRSAASGRRRRSGSRSARPRRSRSSTRLSDMSFRDTSVPACRRLADSLLPCPGFDRLVLRPTAGAAAGIRLPASVLLDARVQPRDTGRRDRAGDRRQGPDELGHLGRCGPDRRVPADDLRRAGARTAARPVPAAPADDRLGPRPGRRLLRPAVRDERRGDRRARRRRGARERLLPARRVRRRAESRAEEQLPEANALLQTVENVSW